MREIKFRGYAVDEMVGSQWRYGTGIHRTEFAEHFAKEVGQSGETFIWTESGWIHIVEGSQTQYTGLKDKNGVEIYEGDIIRFTNGINEVYEEVGTVVFDLEECGYKAQYTDDGVTRCIYLINPKVFTDKHTEITYEIIGNIHENPELLEVAE